jgi:16S rRNA processing protein RimM
MSQFIDNIPNMESVFIEIEGRPVPFFIVESDFQGNDLLSMKLADYDTADKLNEFKSCRVFLTSGDTLQQHNDDYEELSGFSVFDENENKIGTVNGIIQNPRQWLLSILSIKEKEILLPAHEDLILRIDSAKKIITVKIPEGLLEIN